MKRFVILLTVVTVFFASAASAQRRDDRKKGGISYLVSLGLGSAGNLDPDAFRNNFNPSFGGMVEGGVRWSLIELTGSFDYNFFLSSTRTPNDLNVLMSFVNLKLKPLDSTARPYLLVGGGLYSTWIVDLNLSENVLGYQAGAGIELEVDKVRRIFLEGRYVNGQTRKTADKGNTVLITGRLGLTWAF